MKTVKAKLFFSFAIIIFIILTILSFISIEFFYFNEENENIYLLEENLEKVKSFIEKNNDNALIQLDKDINLKNQFLIILKDENLIFTNESKYITNTILDEFSVRGDYNEKDESHFIEEEYVLNTDFVQKKNALYEIIIGIDTDHLDENFENISFTIIFLNITVFIVLLLLAYILINKTIKPLKLILKELNKLQSANDLSKRIKQIDTKDEFEELINSLNKMLENIENSVENIKQFSSDASHELRTPLTVIQGELDLISEKQSKEELFLVLKKIDKEQKKLQEIIKNFLLLSKLEKEVLKNEKTSLDALVFELIEENLEKIEDKKLELKLEIEQDIEVEFNKKYLTIVIDNLLSNAIKYTNEGFIKIKVFKEKNKTFFEIEDSGIGISHLDLEKIFERFYRVDKVRTSSKEGVGLGLSIVRKICESFNCQIKVKSALNKGTVFTIKFKS